MQDRLRVCVPPLCPFNDLPHIANDLSGHCSHPGVSRFGVVLAVCVKVEVVWLGLPLDAVNSAVNNYGLPRYSFVFKLLGGLQADHFQRRPALLHGEPRLDFTCGIDDLVRVEPRGLSFSPQKRLFRSRQLPSAQLSSFARYCHLELPIRRALRPAERQRLLHGCALATFSAVGPSCVALAKLAPGRAISGATRQREELVWRQLPLDPEPAQEAVDRRHDAVDQPDLLVVVLLDEVGQRLLGDVLGVGACRHPVERGFDPGVRLGQRLEVGQDAGEVAAQHSAQPVVDADLVERDGRRRHIHPRAVILLLAHLVGDQVHVAVGGVEPADHLAGGQLAAPALLDLGAGVDHLQPRLGAQAPRHAAPQALGQLSPDGAFSAS